MLKRISDSSWGRLYIIGASLIVVTVSVNIGDPDVFWHLKVGEWIVNHGAIPRYDVYTWSVYGEPWIAHQWAWDVLMHLLHSRLGLFGLWLLSLTAAALSGFLVCGGLRRKGIALRMAFAAGGLTSLLLVGWLKPWPQAGVYVMFAAYLYFSLKEKWDWRDVVGISAVGLLWGNIHSTAVMLPMLLLAEVFWYRVFKKIPFNALKLPLLAVMTSGLMTLVNPYGLGLWRYAIGQGLLTGAYRKHILSWMPYSFTLNSLIIIFFISSVILYVAIKQGKDKCLVFIRALLFWILALFSRIYTPYAVMSTTYLFGSMNFKLGEKSLMRLGLASLVAGIALSIYFGYPSNLEEVAEERNYPVAAAQVIKEENLEKVFNRHGWGGYLLWNDIPVYIDGRNDVYGELFLDYVNLTETEQPLGDVIAETGAETVLFPVNSTIDHALREARLWEEHYRDEVAVIFVKTE